MFWENFVKLCTEKNTYPNPVAAKLGISSGAVTKWKNGSTPNSVSLQKIANYFDCSVEYLLGKEEKNKNGFNAYLEGIDYEIYRLSQELTEQEKEEVLKFIKFTVSSREQN